MANENRNSVLAWPKRILQSIAYGAVDAVKEKMPVMFSTIENNKEAAKQLYQETLGSRQQLKKLQTIQDTYVFKPAKELLKNLKSDIKSGVFYHPERAAKAGEDATKAMMEDLLKEAGMEDMMGMLTGEEGIPEGELQDMPITPVAEVTSGDAFVAATVAQEQRYAVNSLAKIQSDIADAQMHAFRTVGNMQLKGMQKQTNLMQQGFGALIQGFNNINDFHENVLFKHVENSTKYYETMTQIAQENNAIFKEMVEMKRNQYKAATTPEEEDPNKVPNKSALFKNGVFDLGSYIKIVQSNANDAFMMLHMTLAAVQGMIAGIVANPMQFATKQVVSALMGPQLRSALKKFDASITGYIATGLAKIGDFGNDPKSGMLGMLGKLFGIKTDRVSLRAATIKDIKQPRSWDGEDHFYLTQVIPSFLSNIEAGITGNDARIFNPNTGKFTTIKAVKQKLDRKEMDTAFNNTSELRNKIETVLHSNLRIDTDDTETVKDLQKAVNQLMLGIQRQGGFKLTREGKAAIDEVLTNPVFGENENMRKLLHGVLRVIEDADPGAVGSRVTGNVVTSRNAEAERRLKGNLKDLSFEEILGMTGADLNWNNGVGFSVQDQQGIIKNPLASIKEGNTFNNSLLSWQEKIYDVLVDIRDYGTMGGGGGSSSILANIPGVGGLLNALKQKLPGMKDDTPGEKAEKARVQRKIKELEAEEKERQRRKDERAKRLVQGNRGIDDMVDYHYDPTSALNMLQRHRTLANAEKSAEFLAYVDQYNQEGKLTDKYNELEALDMHPENLDKQTYGNWDVMKSAELLQGRGKEKGIRLDRYDSKDILQNKGGAVDTIVRKLVANRDKTAIILKEDDIYNEQGMLDTFFSDGTRRYDIKEKMKAAGFKPEKSFLENLAKAETLGKKLKLLSLSVESIANSPRAILTSVLHTADKMMYEFMFGKSTGDERPGSPIQGLFGKMVSKMDEAAQSLNIGISKVVDNLITGGEKWWDKGLNFLQDTFRFDLGKTKEAFKEQGLQFFNPFFEGTKQASSSLLSDISSSVTKTFTDISDFVQHGQVRRRAEGTKFAGDDKGELAIVSKGESILYPKYNPFNKDRDSMPDYGSMGVPNVSKTGLTYLPKGSAVLPSNVNPWNPNRGKARPEQDALNENRVQEKFDQKLSHYAEGTSNVIADIVNKSNGVLKDALSQLDSNDAQQLIIGLMGSLGITKEMATTLLGEAAGYGAKEFSEVMGASDSTKEIAELIFKEIWKSKAARESEDLRNVLKGLAKSVGYKGKLETNDEILYEEYNKQQGIINGTQQFMNQMFGVDPSRAIEETKKFVIHNTPEMMKGGMAGALVGTLFPLGGPLLGAVGGAMVSILSNNKSFMEYVFGKEIVDENGKKQGRDETGLISAKFVKSLKKYVPDIKKYGITGSLVGLITPFGPLGGLMAGVAASYIKNNEAANRFLFGGDEDSSSGLFSKDLRTKIKKAMPNIGAAALGALFLGPFGIMGNAALGAGLGFLSTMEGFKKIMLGAKDRKGIRHGGLAGAIRRHITEPLKRNFKGWVKDIGQWLKQDLVRPISRAIGPIGRYLGNAVKDTVKDLWYMISEKIAGPGSRIEQWINSAFFGIKKAGGFGKWLAQNVIGGIGTLIGKGIGKLGDMARKRNYRKGNTGGETAAEVLDNLERMGSTDDRTHNMYQNIVDLKAKHGMGVVKEDAAMARELQWAFGHKGTKEIKEHQSKVFGYLTSEINEQTMTNPKLADMHNTLIDYAKTLSNAESEKDVDRCLNDVKKALHDAKIEGKDFDEIMKSFYTNAAEIRLAKVAEQMRDQGLHAHKEALTFLKKTYGFKDLSDDEFIADHLEPLMKALNNEVKMNDIFIKQSEKEQKDLGQVANSSVLEGEGTRESKAMEAYRHSVVNNLQVISKILGAGIPGMDLKLIEKITKTSSASQRDIHDLNIALRTTQSTVAMHQRQDKKAREKDDTELFYKAQAIGAPRTIQDLDMEMIRQTIGTNNRSYVATMIKLGEAEKEGVKAVVKDLKTIMELDTHNDGKLFARIGALTISGLNVPPEQYKIIGDLTDEAFACALQLVRLGITIGDFGIFKKYDKNDKYEMKLLVEMAKYKYHLTDKYGNSIEKNASDFMTAEAMQRNVHTREARSARSFSSIEAYIEHIMNQGSENLRTQDHEIGFAMNTKKSGGTILSDKKLNELDKINADSSEVSQVTGVHDGVYGLAQSAGKAISKGVNYAVDKQIDLLETTGNFFTGKHKLGTKAISAINTAMNMLKDKKYRDDRLKIGSKDVVFSFLQNKADEIVDATGDSAYIVIEDILRHPDHIDAYKNLLNNIGKVDNVKKAIQSITNGIDPFGQLSLSTPGIGNDITAPNKKQTGTNLSHLSFGTKMAGLGTKVSLPHYAGGTFDTIKNFVLGGIAFGGGNKDNSETKNEKPQDSEGSSGDTSKAVKDVGKAAKEIGAALSAATATHTVFNEENTPPQDTGLESNERVKWMPTSKGMIKLVRSSADGNWMMDPGKNNKEIQDAMDKDTELKERIATAIEEMNESFKEGFTGIKKAGKAASGGGILDLFRSAMSLPGEIMSGVAAALVGIPIIGSLIGKVLSPITGLFGKIKSKLGFGGKDAAKGAAKGGGKFAAKALGAIASGVPFPIKLLVAALGAFLGLSLSSSSAEAATSEEEALSELDPNAPFILNPHTWEKTKFYKTGKQPSGEDTSSILDNPIVSAPLNFAAEYPLIPGFLGLGGGMALANAVVSQTKYGKAAGKVDAINKKIAALEADTKLSKEIKDRRIERWERELAKAQAKAGEARIKTPLAAVEKALPNIGKMIMKNKAGASALAVLSALGLYTGKTIYDDSEFARYGSMQDISDAADNFTTFHPDGQRKSSHAYDPYKNGFKNGISMQYQNDADDKKINKRWTDEEITAWLKREQQKGNNIFETYTKNDERVQTAKNTAQWVNDTFIPTPNSLIRSSIIDLLTKGVTGYEQGSIRHSGVSALLKTGADIALGNKELDAGTALDLGKNFASTYVLNNIFGALWNRSNASTTRETKFLDKVISENARNPQLKPQLEAVTKNYAADLANAKARGDMKAFKVIERAQQEELRAVAKQFAINNNMLEKPDKIVNAMKTVGKGAAKVVSLPFGLSTQGNKVATAAAFAGMTALHYGQKYLATPEELERMEREEKEEEDKRKEFEKRMKELPRLQKGEQIVETPNGWAIIHKNGTGEYITEEQKQLYDAAIEYDRNKGSGNVIDRGMTAWEELLRKVPVAGDVLPTFFGSHGLADIAGTTLFSKNRIIGGTLGRLMMDIAQGKEIDAKRISDDLGESMQLRIIGRLWDYLLGRDRQGNKVNRARMISDDFSKFLTKDFHRENLRNLRRTAGIRWIPKIGLNDMPVASDVADMSKMMTQYEAQKMLVDLEDSKDRIKEYRLKNGLSVEELQERAKSDRGLKYQLDRIEYMQNRLSEAGISTIEDEERRKYKEAMDKYNEKEIEKTRQERLKREAIQAEDAKAQAEIDEKQSAYDEKSKNIQERQTKTTARIEELKAQKAEASDLLAQKRKTRKDQFEKTKEITQMDEEIERLEQERLKAKSLLESTQETHKHTQAEYNDATEGKKEYTEKLATAAESSEKELITRQKNLKKIEQELAEWRELRENTVNKNAEIFDRNTRERIAELEERVTKAETELTIQNQELEKLTKETEELKAEEEKIKQMREQQEKTRAIREQQTTASQKPIKEAASVTPPTKGAVPESRAPGWVIREQEKQNIHEASNKSPGATPPRTETVQEPTKATSTESTKEKPAGPSAKTGAVPPTEETKIKTQLPSTQNAQNTPSTTGATPPKTETSAPEPTKITSAKLTASEISLLQMRENNLYNLRNMLPEERVQALAQRETYIQTQLDKLNTKETLTDTETKLKNALLTEQKDLKELSAETMTEYKAGEAQTIKTGKSLNIMDRFKRTSLGQTMNKISKHGGFRSISKFALTTATVMGAGQLLGDEEHEATDEEILQRKLPPGLSIIKDEDGNLVVVGKDGKPLKDQSAVQRKLPIIPPGTDIVYDEEGHMVLVDEETGEPVPDQTPVTANQNATDNLHTAYMAKMGVDLARSAVGISTEFNKTKKAGKFIQKHVGGAVNSIKNKIFGEELAKKEFKLMEKPKFMKNALHKVSDTLATAAYNAKKDKVKALLESKTEKAIVEDAATDGRKKTILSKAKESIDNVISKIRSSGLCPSKWISALKAVGEKLLELMAKPEFMQKILKRVAQHTASMAAGAVTFGIGTAIITAGFAISGFYAGFTEPETLLKIPAGKATTGMKVFCGFIRALEAFPMIGILMMILNESGQTVKILSSLGITEIFGFNLEMLQSMRKEVKTEEQKEKAESQSSNNDEEKGFWDKVKDFFTFDPNTNDTKQRPNASNTTNQQNKTNNQDNNTTEEPSVWQRVKNFFTFNPNLGKGKAKPKFKSYGKGRGYVQQTDPSVANIPIKSGGKFSPNMTGKTAGCQVTAFENARIFGKGYAEDMKLASEYAPDYEDGTTPELSTALANRHGLRSTRVNAQAGTQLLDENTNMVAQVNSSMLSDKDRRAMQFPKGDYAHYITIKKNKNGYSFIDPDDPSGIGHEKALPAHAISSLSNATLIHNTGYGMGKSERVNIINESKDDLYKDAQAMSWDNVDPSLKPDFENDKVEIIRNKILEASKINAAKEYLGGPSRYGKGNVMSVEPQIGGTCTIHSTKNILRAYTGQEPDFDPNNEAYFGSWWGWIHDDRLKITDHGFRQNQRAEFEKTIEDHFSKKPNNPIFLYQTGGDGNRTDPPHPINRVSGNHATIIGRKLSNGKYEDYDSNGGRIWQLDLKDIFDETATGKSQNMEEFGGNYLGIPSVDPSSPITEWKGSTGASALPSQSDFSANQQSRGSTGGLTLEQRIRKRHQLEEIMRGERQDLDPDLLGESPTNTSNTPPSSTTTAVDVTGLPLGKVAQDAAKVLGSSHPELLWAQMMHETGGPDNMEKEKWQLEDHNYGGIKYYDRMAKDGVVPSSVKCPAGESGGPVPYAKFPNDEAFIKEWTNTIKNYPGTDKASTPEEWAAALQPNDGNGNYYEDPREVYASGIRNWLNKYQDKIGNLGKGKLASIFGKGIKVLDQLLHTGKGLFGTSYYDITNKPPTKQQNYSYYAPSNPKIIKDHQDAKHISRPKLKDPQTQRAWDFLSKRHGDILAAVLLANMGLKNDPVGGMYGQPELHWGYFGIPITKKTLYNQFRQKYTLDETDDEFMAQLKFLSHIINTSDKQSIEKIANSNLNTATKVWYTLFDPNINMEEVQKRATSIFDTYSMFTNRDGYNRAIRDYAKNHTLPGDVYGKTDEQTVEELTKTEKLADEVVSTSSNDDTTATVKNSNYLERHGVIGALNDWLETLKLWDVPSLGNVASQAFFNTSDAKKAPGNDIKSKIWNHLAPKYGSVAAAAIMGNMEAESSFNPANINSDSGASGLCQWFEGRNDRMRKFAASKGKEWTDVDTQLEFLDQEIAESYTDTIKSLNNMSIEEAAEKWEADFERSNDENSLPRRKESAKEIYNQFQGQGKGKGKYGKNNFFSNLWDGIKSGAKKAWDTIREPFVRAYNIPSKTFGTIPNNKQNVPIKLDTTSQANITEPVTDIKAPNGKFVTKNDYDYLKNKNPNWDEAAIKDMLFNSPKYKDKVEESSISTHVSPINKQPVNYSRYSSIFDPLRVPNCFGFGKGKYGKAKENFNINEYIIPKTPEGERAWNFLSKTQGKNFAAIVMANMDRNPLPGNSGQPTYAGSFKLSPERQAQYEEYLKNTYLDESDDDLVGQMKYIAHIASNSDPFTMDIIKNKAKLDYGTELWYKAFDPSVNMAETQKRAKQIYVTYTGLGQSQSLAGMERDANIHVPDVLGTTTEQDKAKLAGTEIAPDTTSNTSTSATSSGGALGSIMATLASLNDNSWISKVQVGLSQLGGIFRNALGSLSPDVVSKYKLLFGEKWVDMLTGSFPGSSPIINGRGKSILPSSTISTPYSTQDTKSIVSDKSNEDRFGKRKYGKHSASIPQYRAVTLKDIERRKKEKTPPESTMHSAYIPQHKALSAEGAKRIYYSTPSQKSTSNFKSIIIPHSPIKSSTNIIRHHLPTTSSIPMQNPQSYITQEISSYQDQWKQNLAQRESEIEQINSLLNPSHQETQSITFQEHQITPKRIWDFFQSRGFTPLQTAGAMGNIDIESMGFKPHVWECDQKEYPSIMAALKATKDHPDTQKYGDGWGYGFAQWSSWNGNPRRDNLMKFAKLQGKSDGDWQTQLDFLLKEISEGEFASNQTWNEIDKVNTPEEAADIFCDYVEAPNPEYAHKDWREASARQFYDQFANTVSHQKGKGKYGKAVPLIISGLDALISASRSIILPKLIQRYGQTQALQIFNRIQSLVPQLNKVLKTIGIDLNVETLVNLIDTASQFLDEHKWLSYSNDDLLELLIDLAKKAGIDLVRKRIFGFGKGIKEDLINLQHMEPIKVPQEISSKATEKFWDDSDKGKYGKGTDEFNIQKLTFIEALKNLEQDEVWKQIPDYNKPNYKTDSLNVIQAKLLAIDAQLGTSYYKDIFGDYYNTGYVDEMESEAASYSPYQEDNAETLKAKLQALDDQCGPQAFGYGFGNSLIQDMSSTAQKDIDIDSTSIIRAQAEDQMRNTLREKSIQYEPGKVEDVIQQMKNDGIWEQIPEYNKPKENYEETTTVTQAKLDAINKQFGTHYGLGKGKGKIGNTYIFKVPTPEQLISELTSSVKVLSNLRDRKNNILFNMQNTEPVTDIKAPNGKFVTKNDYDYLKNQGYDETAIKNILFESDKYKKISETPIEEHVTDTIKRIREQPTSLLGVTQSKVDTFKGGEYFNDSSKVSPKVRLYLKNAATLEDVAKDIGFTSIPSDDTVLTAEQQQALGYRNYNTIRTWSHFNTDSKLWGDTPDVDRALGVPTDEELFAKKEDTKYTFKTPNIKEEIRKSSPTYKQSTTPFFSPSSLNQNPYQFEVPTWLKQNKPIINSSSGKGKGNATQYTFTSPSISDIISKLGYQKREKGNILNRDYHFNKDIKEDVFKQVLQLKNSSEWNNIPDYNKPDLENDSISVLRTKLKTIKDNNYIDAPINEAKITSDQIQQAKATTEKIIKDVKASYPITIESLFSSESQLPNKQQPINQQVITNENMNKEQLAALLKEQQQTNNLLLKLIEAILTSGKSIENSIVNNATGQTDPFVKYNQPSTTGGSIGYNGSSTNPLNNNLSNVIQAFARFNSP